ncbi:MAG: 3-hydroxyacyl-CoA dehydrogenase family protein [Candidatus Eremiobacteraeota bacterium]|nr:3-hydroxyacyl-CoA dehydrogenase family protein [Candidatus Eremiobacteraeota bacterium]
MERILIVGAGTMGAGIAFVAARAGFAVDLVDPDKTVRERASIPASAAAVVKFHDAIPTASEAVLAIEAVPERLELKREVFRALESAVGPQTPIATNTSSLSVGSIAQALQRPERAVGMHFFNPPAAMRLVEVVRGEQTADETVDRALEFARQFDKDAVVTADSPGFIVNRVARPFFLQSLRALAAGAAPIEDLDRLARGIGFRMGPFELMDLIGLDINLATSESI